MRKNYVFLFNFKAFPATYIIEKGEKAYELLTSFRTGNILLL